MDDSDIRRRPQPDTSIHTQDARHPYWISRLLRETCTLWIEHLDRETCPNCGSVQHIFKLAEQDWYCNRCEYVFCEGDAAACLVRSLRFNDSE